MSCETYYVQISGDNNHLYGDGLAIWIAKERASPGPVFGSVGESFICLVGRLPMISTYPFLQTTLRDLVFSSTRTWTPSMTEWHE